MIRGPGITPGLSVQEFGLNVDIAPTIAGLLGTTPFADSLVDGHSLLPLVFAPPAEWRKDFMFEFWAGGKPGNPVARGPYCNHAIMAVNNTYAGVRTVTGLKYVDFRPYENIEEAFNLTADPFEMTNLAIDTASQSWVNTLRARLNVLRNCTLDGCW
jgi:N-acetylglucosamine-6-sulfatase